MFLYIPLEFSNNSDNISDDFDSTSELESSSSRDGADAVYGAAAMSVSKVVKELNKEKIDQTVISVRSDEYVNHESDGDDDDGISVITDNGGLKIFLFACARVCIFMCTELAVFSFLSTVGFPVIVKRFKPLFSFKLSVLVLKFTIDCLV